MKKNLLLTALLLSALSINGHAYGAERIVVDEGSSASIISETITNLVSASHGSAVYSKGNLIVADSKFNSNEGRSNYAMGGAIFTSGTATITNTEFTNNKSSYGAAIYNQANLTVSGSKFINNSIHHYNDAFDGAAAIDNNDACNVVLNVTNSYFEGNKNGSRNGGGAVYFGTTSTEQSVIANSEFVKNDSSYRNNNETSGKGGAISVYSGNLLLENNKFTQNKANDGGAIFVRDNANANVVIEGGEFESNYTTTGNGGAIYNAADATISGVKFTGNYVANGNGGAIFASGVDSSAVTEILNSTFTGNKAENGYGGAITSGTKNSMLRIDDTDFTNNSAKWIGAVGIFKKAEITNSTFTGNQAKGSAADGFEGGGAVFVGSEGAVAVLDNVTFKNNTSESSGGAIGTRVGENASGSHNNNSAAILNITNSTFDGNTAATTGGAIDNHFYNENSGITNSIFTNNSAKDGGAIYNHGDKDNQGNAANLNITGGTFTGNTASVKGGAIYTASDATITGATFDGNKIESATAASGGAIFADAINSTIDITNATFTNNVAMNTTSGDADGAAISLRNGSMTIKDSTFEGNKADFGTIYQYAPGSSNVSKLDIDGSTFENNTAKSIGAVGIFSEGSITNTVFKNNTATASEAGAVFLGSEAKASISNVLFEGNTSAGRGGAIATRSATQGNNSALELSITDTSFVNNSAATEGGAIYSAADVTINAQNSNVTFSGNTAADGGDIYMADANTQLAVNIADGKTVALDGGVSGADGYDVAVESVVFNEDGSINTSETAQGTGTLKLDSYLKNADMAVTQATLALGSNANIDSTRAVTITDGGFDTANGVAQEFGDNIVFNGEVAVTADVDLGGGASDNLAAIIEASTNANGGIAPSVVVKGVNAIGNTTANNVQVDLIEALGLTGAGVSIDTSNFVAKDTLTPIRWLKGSVDETTGMVSYAPRGNAFKDFNPAVMAGPVAAQLGGFLSQVNSYNQAFMNMDMKMLMTREERQAMRMRNSYAATQSPQVFSPTYLPEKEKAGWVRPYASFEKVGLDGGPRVNNVMYGSYFGADSDMYQLKNGAEAQFSVYAGYTGSHQTFSGNSIYQNGGTIGLTGIVYKDNFFTALTANTGASVADMSTAFGSEDMPMMMAGVASKTGYNWELAKGKFIVQPSYLMSYTFVNAFDYTNAAGVRIESDPLNAIQIAPGVKFIGNLKNGWQPYVNLRMVWNLMGKSDFTAANTSLPELSVKPYFEYGLGVQKRWGDRFTGFGQAMLRAGGRTGVGLGFGFRWALGKAPAKSFNASDAKNIIQPTSVKLSNIK